MATGILNKLNLTASSFTPWAPAGENIDLNTNRIYFACGGTNQKYFIVVLIYDGQWYKYGTDTAGLTINNNVLKIPQYMRTLILSAYI